MYNRILLAVMVLLLVPFIAKAQNIHDYTIDLKVPDRSAETGFLEMGGSSPQSGTIDFNSNYMSVDGKPFIAIMGEIHFSRLPGEEWEEAILKMKSGGINVICTYVFWSMHEQKEGVFDFSGNLDVRHFVELCRKHNMNVLVRVGPFCHGEIRNGGIPDWLYGRPFQIRTDNPEYLKYVDRLYGKIAEQLTGLYYKDGGNIIGIQLENELQHSAAPWAFTYPGQSKELTVADYDVRNAKDGVSVQQTTSYADLGEQHMATLMNIAKSKGMIVPFYTATGWGNAAVLHGKTMPVTSAYPYPFWTQGVEPSPFYLFKDIQAHPDYEPVRYEPVRYPSFCAEMGVGIQMIYSRRPRVPARASEGLMLRTVGSGANGIGYYMYCGGTTPRGPYGFFSDEPMGVPKMSYDFQAPIGESVKTRDSYNTLRLIHLFTSNFGDRLAPMGVVLPEGNENILPEDVTTLRYSVRKKGNSGFVFITNFQDHVKRDTLKNVSVSLDLPDEKFVLGAFDVLPESNIILPFNMKMENILLKTATAQPLAVIRNDDKVHYFFFAPDGIAPVYKFDKSTLARGQSAVVAPCAGWNNTVIVRASNGDKIFLTTLTRDEALNANKIETSQGELLLLTEADVLQYDDKLRFQYESNALKIFVYPNLNISGFDVDAKVSDKTPYALCYGLRQDAVVVEPAIYRGNYRRWQVNVPQKAFEGVSDLILNVDYVGDTCAAFIDGEMVTDHFYSGDMWRIGLKRFKNRLEDKGMYFYFREIEKNAPFLIDLPEDKPIDFSNGNVLDVRSFTITPEYAFEYALD